MSKAMSKGVYLRPRLDNSHDKNRKRYRVVNLLYYVTPEWRENLRKCGFRLGVPDPPHRRFAAAEDLGCRNSTACLPGARCVRVIIPASLAPAIGLKPGLRGRSS